MLLVGLLCQCGGFFVHIHVGRPDKPSAGTKLTRGGLLIAALITLGVG